MQTQLNMVNDANDAVYAMIVAAGKGSRFGEQTPKQYQKLGAQSVLQHSVARLNVPWIRDLTLVIAEDDSYCRQLSFDYSAPIHWAIGGAERWHSVYSGVRSIRARGAQDMDWILIHDAARPCLPLADLQALATARNEAYGAILATPVVDTLKFAKQYIERTVERSHLWHALTPQMFRLVHLENVLADVEKNQRQITDEASAFEALNLPIKIITGSRMNMKLTYPEDLLLLNMIITEFFDK